MPISEDDYIKASDDLLERLERDADINKREADQLRRELVQDIRNIGATGTDQLTVTRIGNTRVLTPNTDTFRKIGLTSKRAERRFSDFRLQWLSKENIRALTGGELADVPPGRFIRSSKRLARNARIFLREIEELEPSLSEEVEAAIRQIDDAENDLLKLEVRSWTRIDENLRRSVIGRVRRTTARSQLRAFDVNKNMWNLSLLEHPKAVVRDLMGEASTRMARKVTKEVSEIPRRAFVFVGAGPTAIQKMTTGSQAGGLVWRVFNAAELDERFRKRATQKLSFSHWRGLGLSYNTPEWYIPIPPALVVGVKEIMRERRSEFLDDLRESIPTDKDKTCRLTAAAERASATHEGTVEPTIRKEL